MDKKKSCIEFIIYLKYFMLFVISINFLIFFNQKDVISVGYYSKRTEMRNKIKLGIIVFAVLIFVIQFVPVERDNPEFNAAGEIQATVDVKTILKSSCYDCHSNETVWPLYSYIAPVSWLVANDVKEGRRELNFSEWNTYEQKKKNKKAEEIKEEILEGKMPMPIYTYIHQDAKLTDLQKSILIDWFSSINLNTAAE